MDNTTKLLNLINPEVLSHMIGAELDAKLRATQFFKVDRTLTGRAGDTVTIPVWKYIGPAVDLPENEQGEITEMHTDDASFTVKKAVKNVRLTDEAVLSGYDNVLSEAARQLRMSIQDKIDNDAIELLQAITATVGHVHDVESAVISYDDVIDSTYMMEQFREEQNINATLLVSPATAKKIRKSPEFIDLPTGLRDATIITGSVGSLGGARIQISKKLTDNEAYILTPSCFTCFMKRDVNVERERQMLFKRTIVGSDCHFIVAIPDYDKIVALRWAA